MSSSQSGRNGRIDDSLGRDRSQDGAGRETHSAADEQSRFAADGAGSRSGSRFGSSGSGTDDTDNSSQQGSGASRAGSRSNDASSRSSGSKRSNRSHASHSAQSSSSSAASATSDQDGSDFSHTLSQSLAAATQTNTSASSTDSSSDSTNTSNAGTNGNSANGASSDPLNLALALVTQALAGVPPPAQASGGALTNATAGQAGSAFGADGIDGNRAGSAALANTANTTDTAAAGGLLALGKGFEASGLEASQNFANLLSQAAAADSVSSGLATVDGSISNHLTASTNTVGADAGATGTLAAGIQLGTLSHFHSASDANAPSAELKTPVGAQGWSDELGNQITWMKSQNLESASLKLSPEHLGPMQVQISVRDGAASVLFGAHHADTRAAIEQALPRLRELFANQGLTLADAGVSREAPRGQQQQRTPRVTSITSSADVGSTETSVTTAAISRLGLVDTYA